MRPLTLGFAALPLVAMFVAIGCDTAEPTSGTQFSSEITGPITLSVHYTYSGPDWGSEGEDAGTFDEDEGHYVIDTEITLGPVSDCMKPFGERAENTVCSYSGPSEAWDFSLRIGNVGGVAMLDVDMYAGDADSDGGSRLPVSSVPTEAPWTMGMSPDNAGGSWGSIQAQITRIADGDAAPPADEDTSCCVVCSVGQPCGDACIAADRTCQQPVGCACEG